MPLFPKPLQRAALHYRTGQRMADDVFRKFGAFDQGIEIDAGGDTKLIAHENKVFGADIAGRALMAGERTAAEAGHR